MSSLTRFRPLRLTAFAALTLALALGSGCGKKGPTLVAVKGAVFYKGAPVTAGNVYIVSEDFPDVTAGAPLKPDGSFEVAGVPLGKVKVAVQTSSFKPATGLSGGSPKVPAWATKGGGTKYVPIPAKYENTSTSELSYTVEADKTLAITIE